jgi:hypothetical protein
MDQVSVKKYQHLPLQDPPKFAQIWIFGLKKTSVNPGDVATVKLSSVFPS